MRCTSVKVPVPWSICHLPAVRPPPITSRFTGIDSPLPQVTVPWPCAFLTMADQPFIENESLHSRSAGDAAMAGRLTASDPAHSSAAPAMAASGRNLRCAMTFPFIMGCLLWLKKAMRVARLVCHRKLNAALWRHVLSDSPLNCRSHGFDSSRRALQGRSGHLEEPTTCVLP